MLTGGPPRLSAVVLTALQMEFLAVKQHLASPRENVHPRGTVYEEGTFEGISNWKILLGQIGMGNEGAAGEVERAVSFYSPDVILFVGVAGGLKDVAIGDVVAGSKIYAYESGKDGKDFLPRPESRQASYALEQRALAEARSNRWLRRLPQSEQTQPRAFVGAIAAGSKVVSDQQSATFQLVRKQYSDALAVDMEGYGFLHGVRANPDVDALVVRGVSDLVDGKQAADKSGSQARASQAAAAFAFEILANFEPTSPRGAPSTREQSSSGPSTLAFGSSDFRDEPPSTNSLPPREAKSSPAANSDDEAETASIAVELNELATERVQGWEEQAARRVAKLVSSGTRSRGYCTALGSFARGWGWHLKNGTNFERIYMAFDEEETRQFLLALMRCGESTLSFLRSRTISVPEELLANFDHHLTDDEKAEAHFALAESLHRFSTRKAAESELRTAMGFALSKELRERIFLRRRQLSFESCDGEAIRETIKQASETAVSRSLEHARRGSDCLLLGELESGREYYAKALDTADSADERAVALWGCRLALRMETRGERKQREDLQKELAAISEFEAPRLREVKAERVGAGESALAGLDDSAAAQLEAFLDKARDSGWPHSPAHNRTGPLERSAEDLARILLSPARSADELLHGQRVLIRYGLARQARKLLDTEHIHRISSDRSLHDRWIQGVEREDGYAKRQGDAVRAIAAATIPLLPDDALIQRASDILSRLAAKPDLAMGVIDDEWYWFAAYATHVPAGARETLAETACRIIRSPELGPLHRVRLSGPFWRFWNLVGGPAEPLRAELSDAAICSVSQAAKSKRSHWQRDSLLFVADLAEEGLLRSEERGRVLSFVRRNLASNDLTEHTEVYWLALRTVLDTEPREQVALAKGYLDQFDSVRRSSNADLWCWGAATVVGRHPEAGLLLRSSAVAHAEYVAAQRDDSFKLVNEAPAARLLATCTHDVSPAEMSSLSTLFGQLVAADVAAAGYAPRLYSDSRGTGPAALALESIRAGTRDYTDSRRRRNAMRAIGTWADHGGAIDQDLVEATVQNTHADDDFVRGIAYQTLGRLCRDLGPHQAGLRGKTQHLAREQGLTDSYWFVRANAGHALADLTDGDSESFEREFRRLNEDRVAIVRRVGELGLQRPRGEPSPKESPRLDAR